MDPDFEHAVVLLESGGDVAHILRELRYGSEIYDNGYCRPDV
jgi:hypothetical protein